MVRHHQLGLAAQVFAALRRVAAKPDDDARGLAKPSGAGAGVLFVDAHLACMSTTTLSYPDGAADWLAAAALGRRSVGEG